MNAASIHDDIHHCMCCRVHRSVGRGNFARKLEAAHLKKLSMGMRKLDDRRAVILLCGKCHRVYDGPRSGMKVDGVQYPWITWGQAIWMKAQYDARHFDDEFIKEIFKNIPDIGDLEAPPDVFRLAAERETRRRA